MIYTFIYNIVQIKSDFINLKVVSKNKKFILIANAYCIDSLSSENYFCFDDVFEIPRSFHHPDYNIIESIVKKYVE